MMSVHEFLRHCHRILSPGESRLGAAALVFVLVAALTASCARAKPEWPDDSVYDTLLIQAGDVLEVRFRFQPELDTTQTVRADGRITLEILDEVMAAGKTPAQLDQELTARYASELKDPMISVLLRDSADQRVFVLGEVKMPREFPLRGRMSPLQAIAIAGGYLKDGADPGSVVVVRQVGEKRYIRQMDLSKAFQVTDADNLVLRPNDIVYVSRKPIDHVDMFVEQYINRVVPRGASVTYRPNLNTTVGYTP